MTVDHTIRKKLFQVIDSNFAVMRGSPMPLGTSLKRDGINFNSGIAGYFGPVALSIGYDSYLERTVFGIGWSVGK